VFDPPVLLLLSFIAVIEFTGVKLASQNDEANTEFPRNQTSVLRIDFVHLSILLLALHR